MCRGGVVVTHPTLEDARGVGGGGDLPWNVCRGGEVVVTPFYPRRCQGGGGGGDPPYPTRGLGGGWW